MLQTLDNDVWIKAFLWNISPRNHRWLHFLSPSKKPTEVKENAAPLNAAWNKYKIYRTDLIVLFDIIGFQFDSCGWSAERHGCFASSSSSLFVRFVVGITGSLQAHLQSLKPFYNLNWAFNRALWPLVPCISAPQLSPWPPAPADLKRDCKAKATEQKPSSQNNHGNNHHRLLRRRAFSSQ